jgi:hypothetical protein
VLVYRVASRFRPSNKSEHVSGAFSDKEIVGFNGKLSKTLSRNLPRPRLARTPG